MLSRRSIHFILLLFLALLSACGPSGMEVVSETDEKQYQLAKDYQRQQRIDEALNAFLRVIDARRDAPESHLESGYIYLHEMKDPIRAIYHFDRYLQFKPQSPQAAQVRQLIETAEKEFARQLPAQPYQGDLDRVDLMDLVKNLRIENDSLKRDLLSAEARVKKLESVLGQASRVPSSPAPQTTEVRQVQPNPSQSSNAQVNRSPDPATVPRSYIVQSGDSLSTISRRFYGTPSRWIDIYQANRDRLSSENALRVGQEIRIP
ncbi:MAG: LysM peptidoglycan-binding domain-containing protein [Verrucomicrobiota bacterium]